MYRILISLPVLCSSFIRFRLKYNKRHYIPKNIEQSLSKVHSKASNYSHGNSSRSSIQMLPIISGLVEKQVPEFGKKKLKLKFNTFANNISIFLKNTAPCRRVLLAQRIL